MRIQFHGTDRTITGSCHLLEAAGRKILLDCGMYQGSEEVEALNREPFGFDPGEIDCVLLSHAHIDHSGRIPLLVKEGFKGPVYCTEATAELTDIMLEDSGSIQEKDAEYAGKHPEKGLPLVEPLYTRADAEACRERFVPVGYDVPVSVFPGVKAVFREAGHILGSAILEVFLEEEGRSLKLVYTGDLGCRDKQLLRDPAIIREADVLIMETTYGDRVHESSAESLDRFFSLIRETARRGGSVVIPSFAVGRTQELIYELERFYEGDEGMQKELRRVMVYVDSPLAEQVTQVFRRNTEYFDEESKAEMRRDKGLLFFRNLKFTATTAESKLINEDPYPKIIIASSGMCDFGRIKHHLKRWLPDRNSVVLFVGYQAEGTLGREIVEGARVVEIYGKSVPVRAQVHSLEGFSAHGDLDDLLEWLSNFKAAPGRIFLVHGEGDSKRSFAGTVKERLGYECTVVDEVSGYEL